MSNYKLNAIYKQRLRCRLRNSNKYRTNTCLCSHCWVRNVTHLPVLKNRTDMKNIKTKMCCDEFDQHINKVINNELSVPLPPPLPLTVGLLVENKHKYYKSESVADEIKRLWKNREFSIYGEEIPSEFSFTKIDSILQEGPNCGLAALAMAASATPRKLTMEELFADAKNQGFTSQGEMFSASNMAQLAKSVVQPWVNVELLTDGLSTNYDYVLRSLFEGALMLVPYDASGNYAPCCKNGHKSHWAIICGVAKVKGGDPDCYVFARQGKSKYLGLWSFEQLEASNNNLTEFDPKRATDGSTYILPDGGVGVGLARKSILLHLVHRRPDFSSYLELV